MEQRTCTRPGCDKPHRARGLCGSHYNQAFQPDRHKKRPVECVACGRPCDKYPSGDRRPTCSYRCRYRLTYGRDIAEGRELVGPVERRPIPKPEPAAPKLRFVEGACAWCGERFTFDLRIGGVPARFCTAAHASAHHKAQRRAIRGDFKLSPFARRAIYERDAWTCQLCGDPVDPTLGHSDPWGATLDHIECQSWALIADHSARNLRLAHRMCNSLRGDREAA